MITILPNCERVETIFGPPGTGKTTRLIEEVEKELLAGTEPESIAYVSFTRAAIEEARERVREHLKLPQKRFGWFRTIHSMAHKALGIEFGVVMADADYAGVGLQLSRDADARVNGTKPDDRLLLAHRLCAATGLPFTEIQTKRKFDIGEFAYRRFLRELKQWKKNNDRMEFSDLLEQFALTAQPLPVQVAFIDEAQDLTPQQWRVINRAFALVRRCVVAGDDDQAIFEWAGADPLTMLRLHGSQHVLEQSHRVPEVVRQYAERIIQRLPERKAKRWHGTAFAGSVGRVVDFAEITFKHLHAGESYLLLAQHQCFLHAMSQALSARGIVHWINNELSVPKELLEAAEQLHRVKCGERIPWHQCRELLKTCTGRIRQRLGDCVDAAALTQLNPLAHVVPRLRRALYDARRYYGDAPGAVPRDPLVRLSTIHAAKGTQADNVVVNPLQTRASAPAPWASRWADARLYYVAATRARHRVSILNMPGPFRYELPA